MQGQIRNRLSVAQAMTQMRFTGGNPDKCFTKRIASNLLYSKATELEVKSDNRADPGAKFSRVDLGADAFVWVPTNKPGEAFLASLTDEERTDFLYHENPAPTTPRPESRRIVDCRPVKAAPRGTREDQLFREPKTTIGSSTFSNKAPEYTALKAEVISVSKSEIDRIRQNISSGNF